MTCECGKPEVCPQPSMRDTPMKEWVAWWKAHPSRAAFGQSRASIASDARERKRRA